MDATKILIMVKGVIPGGMIVLGLSDLNLQMIKTIPIRFNLKEIGLEDREVFIFNGRTEDAMVEEINKLLKTPIPVIDTRTAEQKARK